MEVAPVHPSLAREELEALLLHALAALDSSNGKLASVNQELASTSQKLAGVISERDNLRRAYRQLMEQFELLRRRIFVAKAERIDATQLELEFVTTKKKLDELAQKLDSSETPADESGTLTGDAGLEEQQTTEDDVPGPRPAGNPPAKPKAKPKGRRNLAEQGDWPEQRIELRDQEREQSGALFIGWEESYKLGFQRPGPVRLVVARAKYKEPEPSPESPANDDNTVAKSNKASRASSQGEQTTKIVTVPMPRLLIRRGLLAPSMLAHIIVQKLLFGMPYFRLEQQFDAYGIDLDRGTMARSVEEVGACLGIIVLACAADARKHAFCLSTDATGVAIRPEPLEDGRRQPCRKGHFFVVLADKKHIFFEYQPRHTSAAVCDMFRGYSGYIQADAHVIYDALFRGDAVDDSKPPPTEVGCWAHARRRLWEAAVCGFAVGREGLLRVRKIYQLDQAWDGLPPSARTQKRKTVLTPLVDEFFEWVRAQNNLSSTERGVVKKALGYAYRQEAALRRFLDDGRLPMDNNVRYAVLGITTIMPGPGLCRVSPRSVALSVGSLILDGFGAGIVTGS